HTGAGRRIVSSTVTDERGMLREASLGRFTHGVCRRDANRAHDLAVVRIVALGGTRIDEDNGLAARLELARLVDRDLLALAFRLLALGSRRGRCHEWCRGPRAEGCERPRRAPSQIESDDPSVNHEPQ